MIGRDQLVSGGVLDVTPSAEGGNCTHTGHGTHGLANLLGHQHVDDGVDARLDVGQAGEHHLWTRAKVNKNIKKNTK